MHYLQRSFIGGLVSAGLLCGGWIAPAQAYIDLAPTLAKIISDSQRIAVVEVVAVQRDPRQVVLKEVAALKGEPATEPVTHCLTTAERPAIARAILQWATPGARAVLFASRSTALVCVGQGWYQVRAASDGRWMPGKDRPDLPLAYYGSVPRLSAAIGKMLKEESAVLTVVAHGADDEAASFDLALNRHNLRGLVRLQRIRATAQMPSLVLAASNNPAYLLGVGAVAEEDLPALVEALHSADAAVRQEAAQDLRTLGPKAKSAAAQLAELLSDPAPSVTIAAASALLATTGDSPAAREVLARALEAQTPTVRAAAAQATGLAGSAASPLVPSLARLLSDADEAVKVSALEALATLGPAASTAAAAVLPLLDEAEFTIDAADALGRLGPSARPALNRLAKLLQAEQPAVRWAAVRAMAQIGGDDAHPAVDFMIAAFKQPTEVEGYNMMIYLALLGPVARDAIPTIRGARIKNPVLPWATLWAIEPDKTLPWQIERFGPGGPGGPGGGPGGPGGRGGGPGGGPDFAVLIYESYIRELGPRLRPAARLLVEKLLDGSAGDVPGWGWRLLNCDPQGALQALVPYLASDQRALRQRAVVALGHMGSAAAPARPQVEAALSRADDAERRLLAWCLREVSRP